MILALSVNAEDIGGVPSASIVQAIKSNPNILNSPQAQQVMAQKGVTASEVLQKVDQASKPSTAPTATTEEPVNKVDADKKGDEKKKEEPIFIGTDVKELYRSPLSVENTNEYAKRLISRQIRGQASALQRYGFEFFSNKNGMDLSSLPVPENYRLVPKDVLSIILYGPKSDNMSLAVDKEGNIIIPSFGPLHIAGLSFADAKKTISDALMSAFPNVGVTVNITQFSTIQVTLAGEVATPGIYNVSSFSTVKEALISAGGLSKNGSMRSVLIKRGGRVYKDIDLYTIIRGSGRSDPLLQAGDIIVVPVMGKSVVIDGDVKRPAIYEAKNSTTIGELIALAGGLSANASKNDIRITRYEAHQRISALNVSLAEAKKMVAMDQDSVYVHGLDMSNLRGITLYGNIVKPGFWPLPKEGMGVRDFFKQEIAQNTLRGVFLEDTYFDYAIIKRIKPDLKEEIIGFSLAKVLNGEEKVSLYSRDQLFILNRSTVTPPSIVKISGECIARPGEYRFFDKMTFESLMNTVGTTCPIDRKKVTIVSSDPVAMTLKVRVVDTIKEKVVPLKEFDDIRTIGFFTTNPIKQATISGEVYKPGTYPISEATTLKDIILAAGGMTDKASTDKIEIIRYKVVDNIRTRIVQNLTVAQAMSDFSPLLSNYDEVTVFKIPKWNERKVVKIMGKVKYPGEYAIEDGEHLSNLIQRAGGFTEGAYTKAAVFTREELKQRQQEGAKREIKSLEDRILFAASQPTQAGQNPADKMQAVNMIAMLKEEIEKTVFVGRLSIHLDTDLQKFQGNNSDVVLKNGDALYIPEKDESVFVQGEVLNPNATIYNASYSIDDYIEKSGGIKESADTSNIFVVHSDGDAEPRSRGFFSANASVGPGDTVIVPIKINTFGGIQFAKDITAIIYQMAVSVAALHTIGSF
ncbi:SLBB domain-containing protein [Sulfuricurvum sp.]|uniref:SLBB domain-containing protein n=1 Tax=Sulfuricurvum sp. TaxID=2025608 RepID=UPI0025FA153D|nr:SLBB domain-containing protein [Sulfuricurvum sp.]